MPRSLSGADTKKLIEEVWREVKTSGEPIASSRDPRFFNLRNVAALEILFATGMRVGELVELKLTDWCESEASFVVNGKGSRQRIAFLPDVRSLKAVNSYMLHRTAISLNDPAVFVNASGGKMTAQGIARMIVLTARKAAISKRVTPHMMLHTVATLLLRNGADIRVVQEILGHASNRNHPEIHPRCERAHAVNS